MLALFQAFSSKCVQIQREIKMGDDVLVATLDRELAPLVATILAYRACNMLEVYMQLQFMSNLIRQEADDQTSVMRNCSALTTLLHRYFAGAEVAVMDALLSASAGADRGNAVFGDDQVLSDLVLDSLPDRVAVITRDYRYLYSNAANNAYMNTRQMDLLGRHLSEFIGVERFEQRAKHKLDACFAGENVDYIYRSYFAADAEQPIRCRMTPVRAKGEIIGALLMLQDVRVTADMVA